MRNPGVIPNNFENLLTELKAKTFKYKVDLQLRANGKPAGSITHYSVDANAFGNMVLVPGLASNTTIEPLMKMITFWALNHRYNVYCLDSFLGDFIATPTRTDACANTYDAFIRAIDNGMRVIEQDSQTYKNKWTAVIAHSAGGSAVMRMLNRRVKNNEPINISSVILFAPPFARTHTDRFNQMYFMYKNIAFKTPAEYEDIQMNICNTADLQVSPCGLRYIPILPKFLNDVGNETLRLDLMSKWNFPVTIVAGGRDKKIPPTDLAQAYERMAQLPNGKNFKFIIFPNSKHSFIDQYKYSADTVKLIQTQITKTRLR